MAIVVSKHLHLYAMYTKNNVNFISVIFLFSFEMASTCGINVTNCLLIVNGLLL